MITQIRAACESRRDTGSNHENRDTPCWRTNEAMERKALDKLFSRHKATADDAKEALTKKIIDNILAQKRYRKTLRSAKQFVSQPRQLSVYLNQDGHLDEFAIPTSELKAGTKQECHVVGCSNPGDYAHGEKSKVCREHLRDSLPNDILSEFWLANAKQNTTVGSMLRISADMKKQGATKEGVHDLIDFMKPIARRFGRLPYNKGDTLA